MKEEDSNPLEPVGDEPLEARIVAWVKARNILSDVQRKKVEDAAKKAPGKHR